MSTPDRQKHEDQEQASHPIKGSDAPDASGELLLEIVAFVAYCKDLETATTEGKRGDVIYNVEKIRNETDLLITNAKKSGKVEEKEEEEVREKMRHYFEEVRDQGDRITPFREEFLSALSINIVNKGKKNLTPPGELMASGKVDHINIASTRTVKKIQATVSQNPAKKKIEDILNRIIDTTDVSERFDLESGFYQALRDAGIVSDKEKEKIRPILKELIGTGRDEARLQDLKQEILDLLHSDVVEVTEQVPEESDTILNIGAIMGGASSASDLAEKRGLEFLTYAEVLERLQIDEEELKILVSNNQLRGFRAGSQMKFKRVDVESLINSLNEELDTEPEEAAIRTFESLVDSGRGSSLGFSAGRSSIDLDEEGEEIEPVPAAPHEQPLPDLDEEDSMRNAEQDDESEDGDQTATSSSGRTYPEDPDVPLLEREIVKLQKEADGLGTMLGEKDRELGRKNEKIVGLERKVDRRFKGIIAVGLLALLAGGTAGYFVFTGRQKQQMLTEKEAELQKALADVAEVESRYSGLQQQFAEVLSANAAMSEETTRLRGELQLSQAATEKLAAEIARLASELEVKTQEVVRLTLELEVKTQEAARVSSELEVKTQEVARLTGDLATMRAEVARRILESTQAEQKLRESLAQQTARFEAITSEAEALRIRIEELRAANPAAVDAERMAALRVELTEKARLLEEMRTQMGQQALTLEDNAQTMEALRGERTLHIQQLEAQQLQIQQQALILAENAQAIEDLNRTKGLLTLEVASLREALGYLSQERDLLNEQLAASELARASLAETNAQQLLENLTKQAEIDRLNALNPNIAGVPRHIQLINKFRARQPLLPEETEFLIDYYQERVNTLRTGYGEFLRSTNARYQEALGQNSADHQNATFGNTNNEEVGQAFRTLSNNNRTAREQHTEALRQYTQQQEEAARELQLLRSMR